MVLTVIRGDRTLARLAAPFDVDAKPITTWQAPLELRTPATINATHSVVVAA